MMRKLQFTLGMVAVGLLTTACGHEQEDLRGTLAAAGAGGRVVAYNTAWRQGYIISPHGKAAPVDVAGSPTLAFTTPDQATVLLLDRLRGAVTAYNVTTGNVARYAIRPDRDLPEFSADSRFVLWHASGKFTPSGSYDPNELSLLDLREGRSIDLSVGTNPKAVAFYEKAGDPRVLLFSPGKMTQIRIDQLFASDAQDNSWKQTRDLSPTVKALEIPRVIAQTDDQLFVVIAGIKEFLAIELQSAEELPPVNFKVEDVDSPIYLTLSPPVPATAETVFFRDNAEDTRFLYVLNNNKTLTVFDTNNLGRSRIIDFSHVGQAPDTVYATPDGKRVLLYKRNDARALYRLTVRTGNISTIPFKEPVAEFLHAPDGQSVVAVHAVTASQPRSSFTYVNFTEVFDPILLPDGLQEFFITADSNFAVFRFAGAQPLRKFDLKLGLLDEERAAPLLTNGTVRMGNAGGGSVFAFMDDPLGRVLFLDMAGGYKEAANFVVDDILDR